MRNLVVGKVKKRKIADNFGSFVAQLGITDKQIDQLIVYTNSDCEIASHTSDPIRFKNKQSFNKWKEKGRLIYVMTDRAGNGDLLGMVWFGKSHLPNKIYLANLANDVKQKYGFTFAIRIYGSARGQRLSRKFMSAAFKSFKNTTLFKEAKNNGVWLATSIDNPAAVSAYTGFGFERVTEPDKKGRIIMIYKMNIQIKKSTDSKAALDIARKNPHFFNSNGLKTMEEDFKTGFLLGAYDGEEMVGFIAFKELNDQAIELSWIAVDPKYQGRGVGTFLVDEGLKSLPKKYLVCETKTLSEIDPDSQYARTRKFYKKLGFIPLETINPYPGWGNDNPCQIFVKIL